jgi:hypothetical protein
LSLLPTEEDISFLASRFGSLSGRSEIRSLGADLLSRVLSHSELRLESEDSLFRLIETLCDEDESHRVLIDFVDAQYLSDSCIGDYISFVDSDQLSGNVWMSICRRLSLHVRPPISPRTRSEGVTFSPGDLDNGIIAYLTAKCGGNVHAMGLVTITSKSADIAPDGPDYWMDSDDRVPAAVYVADLHSESDFWSEDAPGQWICWDFRNMRVRLTGYTMTTGLVKSWVVEGSLDGQNWEEIDRHSNDKAFSRANTAYFDAAHGSAFRFLRLTQTGERHPCGSPPTADNRLYIRSLEFFGTLFE